MFVFRSNYEGKTASRRLLLSLAARAMRSKETVSNFEIRMPLCLPALIGTGCTRIGLGVRFKNEVVEGLCLSTDSQRAQ